MVAPEYAGVYDEALISLVARRYSLSASLVMEHPTDEIVTSEVLQHYQFQPQRTLIHMRWQTS